MAIKEKKERFIVEFLLLTDKYQEDILNKRLEICRRLYNQLVKVYNNRYQEMTKTIKYREVIDELNLIKENTEDNNKGKRKTKTSREKELYAELNELYRIYGFSDYSMQTEALRRSKPFVKNIDSTAACKIGSRLWTAWNKVLFSTGKNIHYQKFDMYNSVEGKSNKSGIRIRKEFSSKHWQGKKTALTWNGLEIPVAIDYSKPYEAMSMTNEIAYTRIVRKLIRGKYKFYAQIVFKGTAPLKIDKNTGEIKRTAGKGIVGIAVSSQTVAVSTDSNLYLYELAEGINQLEEKKKEISQAMDRSRRATNPENYNDDGTIKVIEGEILKWNKSNHYKKLQKELQEIHRKQAAVRKNKHQLLANHITSLGDTFYIRDLNYKGIQKNYGKLIGDKAPSLFVQLLEQRINSVDATLTKINLSNVLSKKGSENIKELFEQTKQGHWLQGPDGDNLQKDLYTAFILKNMVDSQVFDKAKYLKDYENYKKQQDFCISDLKSNNNTSKLILNRIK